MRGAAIDPLIGGGRSDELRVINCAWMRSLGVAIFAVITLAASAGAAEPRHPEPTEIGTARQLFEDGRALLSAEKWPEAAAKLEEALRLDPEGGGIKFNLALAYEHLGRVA